MDPPDPIPNSEVKHNSADGSVGLPHVRVGHRQVICQVNSDNERDLNLLTRLLILPKLTFQAMGSLKV